MCIFQQKYSLLFYKIISSNFIILKVLVFITKMKLKAVSKANYRVIAESLGIYPWIRASKNNSQENR